MSGLALNRAPDSYDDKSKRSKSRELYPPYYQNGEEEFVDEGEIEYPFEEITGSGDENKIRGNWSSSMDYYLAVFGFTFALGNLWRFPYQCQQHGGLAYLIPYLVLFLTSAIPVLFMELALGQFISLGPTSVWKVAPLFKGIGFSMIFICSLSAIYFNMVTGWALMYVLNSLKFTLPWATCGNSWNTEACSVWNRGAVETCRQMNGTILANGTCIFNSAVLAELNATAGGTIELPPFAQSHVMPSLEYFHNEILMLSSGIENVETINWQLAICLLVAWAAVFLCSFKGIKTSGKVVYVTVVLPYIIVFVLVVRFLTLPGSLNGLYFFFNPRFEVLRDLKVWGDAAVQVFYSLSTCTGGLIMLSSYNRFHNNIFRDIWIIGMVDLFTSLLVSSLVFSAIGFVCYEMDLLLEQFKLQDGVQLVFVFFAEAISKLPVAPLHALLFFLMVALIIFNTELFMVETVVSSICDEFPERLRKNHRHVLTFVLFFFYLLGVPLCSTAGLYWVVLFENFVATWPLIIIAFFQVTVICWVYGTDNFLDNIRWMTHFYPPIYLLWKVVWKFLCPLIFLVILTFVWLEYRPMSYGGSNYPFWATILGWSISASPLVFIFCTAIVKFCLAKGRISERWQRLLCPEDDWGPALAVHRAEYYPLQIPEARRLMPVRYGQAKKTPIIPSADGNAGYDPQVESALMATKGAKAAALLYGKAVKLSRIGVEQIPCVQVRCRENEFDSYLKMYFARSLDFWAIDDQVTATGALKPSQEVGLGDTVLIQPVESSKRPLSTVTHKIIRVINRYGSIVDPVTKKRIVENRFSEEWDLEKRIATETTVDLHSRSEVSSQYSPIETPINLQNYS
ncbi:Transporter [Aphelenchoides besseyi]|nr:Transporter [Aphelenchoides besseyi]